MLDSSMNRIANWIFNSIKWPEKLDFDSWGCTHYWLFQRGIIPKTELTIKQILFYDCYNFDKFMKPITARLFNGMAFELEKQIFGEI